MKYPKPSPNWNIASNLYCTPSFAITTVRSCRMECRWHKEPEGKDPTCFFYHDRLRTQRSGFLLRNFQKPETQRSIYWWEHEIYWQIKFLSCIARQLAHQVLQKKGSYTKTEEGENQSTIQQCPQSQRPPLWLLHCQMQGNQESSPNFLDVWLELSLVLMYAERV